MIEVRPAERRDILGIFAMWEALSAAGTESDPRYRTMDPLPTWGRAQMADLWVCRKPFPGCFVADDGTPCGFVAGTIVFPSALVEPVATVRIETMYVAPHARRQGVGRRLVEAFIGAAAQAGFRGVEVGTLIKDERAVAFWKGLGFDPTWITLVRP